MGGIGREEFVGGSSSVDLGVGDGRPLAAHVNTGEEPRRRLAYVCLAPSIWWAVCLLRMVGGADRP